MEKKEMLYEGKAKKVYTTEDPDVLIVSYKDDATAFNGLKKGTIVGKGAINNRMTNFIFKKLEEKGVPTHLVEELNDRETAVKKVEIVPLEVIIRNYSAGSFAKKMGMEEGIKFKCPTLEFSYKNDDLGDPSGEARCIFEYIYFARPDSVFDGVSVYKARIQAGRFLAADSPVEADLVVGVPESGNAAALGYAMESGIPYGTAFVKNSYVGRTFIKPKQSSRESAVRIKLNVLKEAVSGKRVIMIDDSIVRGTTSALIVKMLRDAGAREVHVRISAPPFLHPCYFGTDIPSEDQLIAHGRTVDEVRQIIGADTLSFLRQERLSQMASERPVCTACFTGDYPMEPPSGDIRGSYEK